MMFIYIVLVYYVVVLFVVKLQHLNSLILFKSFVIHSMKAGNNRKINYDDD